MKFWRGGLAWITESTFIRLCFPYLLTVWRGQIPSFRNTTCISFSAYLIHEQHCCKPLTFPVVLARQREVVHTDIGGHLAVWKDFTSNPMRTHGILLSWMLLNLHLCPFSVVAFKVRNQEHRTKASDVLETFTNDITKKVVSNLNVQRILKTEQEAWAFGGGGRCQELIDPSSRNRHRKQWAHGSKFHIMHH